jgi:hypothetical protein
LLAYDIGLTVWYWLTLLCLLASLVVSAGESLIRREKQVLPV